MRRRIDSVHVAAQTAVHGFQSGCFLPNEAWRTMNINLSTYSKLTEIGPEEAERGPDPATSKSLFLLVFRGHYHRFCKQL